MPHLQISASAEDTVDLATEQQDANRLVEADGLDDVAKLRDERLACRTLEMELQRQASGAHQSRFSQPDDSYSPGQCLGPPHLAARASTRQPVDY